MLKTTDGVRQTHLRELIEANEAIHGKVTAAEIQLAREEIYGATEDVAVMEAVMHDDILEKLRGLKAWRDYEERVEQRGQAKGEAKAEVAAKADDLKQFFYLQGDKPSTYALNQIDACTEVAQLNQWLRQAYTGDASAKIFPEP